MSDLDMPGADDGIMGGEPTSGDGHDAIEHDDPRDLTPPPPE